MAICAKLDETADADIAALEQLRTELNKLLETECQLLKNQMDLGESWKEKKKIVDAFESENLDPETRCDAPVCFLKADHETIQWIECADSRHNQGLCTLI
jgi:hypothetical protein